MLIRGERTMMLTANSQQILMGGEFLVLTGHQHELHSNIRMDTFLLEIYNESVTSAAFSLGLKVPA